MNHRRALPAAPSVALLLAILSSLPSLAGAQSESVLLCDGSGTAISKPVGNEQWSIQFDLLLNTANGTVFDPVDESITFVSCIRTGATFEDFVFDCASPAADDPSRWDVFAEDVSLPPEFFELDPFYRRPSVDALISARMRVGTDRPFPTEEAYFLDVVLDAETDGSVIRGTNQFTGNPYAIGTTFTDSLAGVGPANFFGVEFADEECAFLQFNVQLLPPAEGGEGLPGIVSGSGFVVPRDEQGECVTPDVIPLEDVWGAAGVIGPVRTSFPFGASSPLPLDGRALASAAARTAAAAR